MKLGLQLGYSGKQIAIPIDLIRDLESMGYDSVWTAESYGNDAVTAASWILAQTQRIKVGTCIMQIPARTPALCAMTAMSLSQLSGNRFIIGIGASGPQVVEGWHGVPYGKPVTRTREYIEVMRVIMAREGPVSVDGEIYQLPYKGPGATGLGKPLKSILEADPHIPIYTASITPAGLRCAGEYADGVFPVWMDPDRFDVLGRHLQDGFDNAESRSLADFAIVPSVTVSLNSDLEAAYNVLRPYLALYIGGMGAKNQNFYTRYTADLGYADEAFQIQDLYLAGEKAKAEALVPKELMDAIALIGPKERIIERLEPWKQAASRGEVDTMLLSGRDAMVFELLAKELL